ncbi:MAG: septal ring lytic transglycosylase RlpA family protein, partial [Proteobacteria bacterium]|nr:septal ring lytic transglycosylase RlpA family protein [Pseudomonadota bacterium]
MIKILRVTLLCALLISCSNSQNANGYSKNDRSFSHLNQPHQKVYRDRILSHLESSYIGNNEDRMTYSDDDIDNEIEVSGYDYGDYEEGISYEENSNDEDGIEYVRSHKASNYKGYYKVGNPYKIKGITYYPKEYNNYEEVGEASWYGKKFHGKKTANGEIYNMGDLTAAHRTLPLPSIVRVTNLNNGKTLIVKVNDR